MKLLIATHNREKLREYRELLGAREPKLVTLDDVGIARDVEETGATFLENARIKADAYAAMSGLPTLADDSGLEVDALGGDPGVYSKRYAGDAKTDAERNEFLLDKLRNVPQEKRTARFRCVIVLNDARGNSWTTEGVCKGEIGFEPRGTNGFGYDPVFVVADRGLHLAELSSQEKNQISHRANALRTARPIIQQLVKEHDK